jgi:CHAT domain-containing protein
MFKGAEATGRELNQVLRSAKYDIIHFSGHAYFDGDGPDLSGLVLQDACESVLTANEDGQQNMGSLPYVLQNPAEGQVSALIYGGALGCIGRSGQSMTGTLRSSRRASTTRYWRAV